MNSSVRASTASAFLLATLLLLSLSGCQSGTPTDVLNAESERYRFLFDSEQQIQDLQINHFENELILLGVELTPEAEEYMEQGQALVGLLPSDQPLLHPNGVVEITEKQQKDMTLFELEGTDPRLPAAFRTFEAAVAFGLFNPGLPSHRQMMREYLEFRASGRLPSNSRLAVQAAAANGLCGNLICDFWDGEDAASCPGDCALPGEIEEMGSSTGFCGDGTCDPSEDSFSCPQDCSVTTVCGDGICDPSEDSLSCPTDCSGFCGDLICDPALGEDCSNCTTDCGMCPGDDDDSATPGDDDDSATPGDDDDSATPGDDDDATPGDDDDATPGDDDDATPGDDDDSSTPGDDDDSMGDDDDSVGDDDDSVGDDDDDSSGPGDDDDSVSDDDDSMGDDDDSVSDDDDSMGDDDDSTPPPPENTAQLCSDGEDNDEDEDIDCADSDCSETAACSCAADCYPIWTSTANTPGSITVDWSNLCSNGGYGPGAYTGYSGPLGNTSAWCRGDLSTRDPTNQWIVGDRTMTFNQCHVEGSARIHCDWNDATGDACMWGTTVLDRAACAGTGKDTGSMKLTTMAEAGYGTFLLFTADKNKGKAVATGTLKAAHWQTGTEKYVDGNTTIATKAGGINCTVKPVSVDCELELTVTGPPSPSCSIGAGFSCATVPPKSKVNQTWTSKIQSTSTDADIAYVGGGNSVSVGGKGVKGAAEAYAKNGKTEVNTTVGDGPSSGYWWLQGAEGKASVRSVVEANLEAVSVIRQNPSPNVTTSCTKVSPPENPDLGSKIRISCGEKLLEPVQ